MNLKPLQAYLHKAANSQNPLIQGQALNLEQLVDSQQDEHVIDADLESKNLENKEQNKDVEDVILQRAMQELQLPDKEDQTTFGKVSAWEMLKVKAGEKKCSSLLSRLTSRICRK